MQRSPTAIEDSLPVADIVAIFYQFVIKVKKAIIADRLCPSPIR